VFSGLFSLVLPSIDWLLRMVYRIKPLRADGSSIISIELRRYNGRNITLEGGTAIKHGDPIIELHLNSGWFKTRRKDNTPAWQTPWKVRRYFIRDLSLLAKQMSEGTFSDRAALHTSTLLYQPAQRLGFQMRELPDGLRKRCSRSYLAMLRRGFYLPARGHPATRNKREIKEVWFPREAFLKAYLTERR
jgi:hypothetical protein